ncbi:MAG: tripartite tricarboxylate transporter substrate binding protein [Pseudomonadota bacterium]
MRSLLAAGALALAAITSPGLHAQTYPSKPITLVVPFGAGGGGDVYARILQQKLGTMLGQPVIVDNKPGAGSVIGTDFVAKSRPDGYTLVMISTAQLVNETLVKKKPYELMRDLVAVAPINAGPLVLVVRSSLPIRSIQDLVQQAKASPGKFNYASAGVGTPYHMAAELFKNMAGIDMVHVPYKSSGAARADVVGGTVQMMFDGVNTMKELIANGSVRPLAVTSGTRSPVLPDVPTLAESGYPGYAASGGVGLMAPRGTPAAVITLLNQSMARIASDPDMLAALANGGQTAVVMTPAEYTRFIESEIAKWRKVIEDGHISAD